MELREMGRTVRRRWWLVAIPVVVVAIIVVPTLIQQETTATGGYTVTIRYSAAQMLDAIPNRDGDYQDVWLASELTVNALTDWVRSSSFVDEISQTITAGTPWTPSALGIAADNKRSVGQLILSYPDAQTLDQIARAAIQVLKNRAQAYFPQLGGQPAQITVLDSVQVTPAPPALTNRLAPVIRLGLGLLAGLGLAFLAEYLDPTVRGRQQLEARGIMVVGSIPVDIR